MHRRHWAKGGRRNEEEHLSHRAQHHAHDNDEGDDNGRLSSFVQVGVLLPAKERGDDDESSSSSSSSSSSRSLVDVRDCGWSLASNSLFLAGSAIQAYLALWELLQEGEADDDAVSSGLDDEDENGDAYDRDDYMATFASTLFVVNALVDLAWVRAGGSCRRGDDDSRRDISSAATFGIGAALEAVSTLFPGDEDLRQYGSNMLSCHVYLLSGLLSIRGHSSSLAYRSPAEAFMSLGLLLFAAGSLIDVVMSYLYDPELSNISTLTLARCNLASSLLWLLDAIFYMTADFILYSVPGKIVRLCQGSIICRYCGLDEMLSRKECEADVSVGDIPANLA